MGLCDEKPVTNIIRLNAIHITYKHSVPAPQRMNNVSIAKTRPLMQNRRAIAVYRRHHKEYRQSLHCVCKTQSF